MRAIWPQDRPMSVRISATDWHEAGTTGDDAAEIARAFKAAGADLIDVSAVQTTPDAKPVYGRMFQTPYSDKIRNEVGIATMAVGNITDVDQVDAILAGARADLVALGRPHLADPPQRLGQVHRKWVGRTHPPAVGERRGPTVRRALVIRTDDKGGFTLAVLPLP